MTQVTLEHQDFITPVAAILKKETETAVAAGPYMQIDAENLFRSPEILAHGLNRHATHT